MIKLSHIETSQQQNNELNIHTHTHTPSYSLKLFNVTESKFCSSDAPIFLAIAALISMGIARV